MELTVNVMEDGTEAAICDGREHNSLILSFVQLLRARDCSPNTILAYQHDLKRFFAYLAFAGLTIEGFNVGDLIGLIAYLTNSRRGIGGRPPALPALITDRLAPATVNRNLAAVSTFYEHLALMGVLGAVGNPLEVGERKRTARRVGGRSMRMRQIQRIPRPLSDDQVAKLLSTPKKLRDRAMLLLLLQGGIRVGELLNLHLEDIQYGQRRIIIRHRSNHPRGVRTKSRCERLVDLLEPETLSTISNYVIVERPCDAPTSHVFLVGGHGHRRCEPLGYDAFVKLFRRLRKKAMLEENWITPHTLRHTHATQLWECGMRELALQKRLGHASFEATRIYTRVSDAGMLADYQRALSSLQSRKS